MNREEIKGLSIRQPWAWAIAAGYKPVENRTWAPDYRGLLAIHASKSAGPRYEWEYAVELVSGLADVPASVVEDGMQTRSAIIAVARLDSVCHRGSLTCGCGPWAVVGQRHLRLADVHALPVPVSCNGVLGLWQLPDYVEAAVRAQLVGEVPAS